VDKIIGGKTEYPKNRLRNFNNQVLSGHIWTLPHENPEEERGGHIFSHPIQGRIVLGMVTE
jgi:hypothetical protein